MVKIPNDCYPLPPPPPRLSSEWRRVKVKDPDESRALYAANLFEKAKAAAIHSPPDHGGGVFHALCPACNGDGRKALELAVKDYERVAIKDYADVTDEKEVPPEPEPTKRSWLNWLKLIATTVLVGWAAAASLVAGYFRADAIEARFEAQQTNAQFNHASSTCLKLGTICENISATCKKWIIEQTETAHDE